MVCKLFLVAGTVARQLPTFTRTDTKLYVSVVMLSTQDNVKLLEQLKSRFKRKAEVRNQYLHYLIDPVFHGVVGILVYHMEILDIGQVTSDIFLQS